MKRICLFVVAALLVEGAFASTADAQYINRVYEKPYAIYAGNDSLYKASNKDSTQLLSEWASATGAGIAYTNWLDISNLAVPDFIESYMDTVGVKVTSAWRNYGAATGTDNVADSLIVPMVAPIGMRLTAWCTSKAATTDTVMISVHVSNDKIGFKPVMHDWIEPGAGTTAELLADASTVDSNMNIPAGLLLGWKYMRLAVSGDNNHKADLGIKIYHWFRLYQPIGDFGKTAGDNN